MNYISTRGNVGEVGFIDAVLMGLADDGGLLIPKQIPRLSEAELTSWSKLDYKGLALEIFSRYINEEIPQDELKELIEASYSTFRDSDITPVRKLNDNSYVLELFHGPTFAFKDVALQFLGNLYSYIARKRNSIINILGATSGDTGASAIEGVRGKEGIRISILHPHQRVSKVQELQMTTVDDANVLNLAVKGNFDDCQTLIKELFADVEFKNKYHLRAINSINFARILAQTVYYFFAYFQVTADAPGEKVNFSVPTGNFGDIFAGYLAKQMGLPVNKLILATNENNILERFIKEGVYQPGEFHITHSPSMDIQIASNFERYLFYLYNEDASQVADLMRQFKTEGKIVIDSEKLKQVQADFAAHGVKNDECLDAIRTTYESTGYLLDPHTACGIAASSPYTGSDELTVTLATAHPAKFDESIQLVNIKQEFPVQISQLFDKPQYQTVVEHSKADVVEHIVKLYQA
ncbi:threonine synthase [Paenibacillus sp. GCM10012307]|uniref:Threonine synthase n=1 Tax=Paenibacillus roseus TaxID=2798579 RepID=A0A934J6W8_9BACL|nr:threonine synthase [Paenibacillus roseus]MBJ6364020.1 threonine synthase [Paenibacillus roseus]